MWVCCHCHCVYVRRWCKLLRHEKLSHIVVVIVEAVGATDFVTFPECFPFLVDKFPMVTLSFYLILPLIRYLHICSTLT